MHIDNDNVLQLSINALRHHCNNEKNVTGMQYISNLLIRFNVYYYKWFFIYEKKNIYIKFEYLLICFLCRHGKIGRSTNFNGYISVFKTR